MERNTVQETFNVDEEVLKEFNEVSSAISTDEEPFDTDDWLEAMMENFVSTQKQTSAWNNYSKSK